MRYQEAEFDGQKVKSVVIQLNKDLTKPYVSLTHSSSSSLNFVHRLIFNEVAISEAASASFFTFTVSDGSHQKLLSNESHLQRTWCV
jgi:hypothetical protein